MHEQERILVISPHTDDGELGAGGSISRWCEEGKNIYYVAFSTAEQSVPTGFPKDILKTEVVKATSELGILKDNVILFNYEVRKLNYVRQNILEDLVYIRKEINPDRVLIPCLSDIHQDHTTVASEALRAFKNKTMLSYELIWNNIAFNCHSFVVLNKSHIERKILSLSMYESQKGRAYMSGEFITALARTRGVQIGVDYAETFEVVRWIQE